MTTTQAIEDLEARLSHLHPEEYSPGTAKIMQEEKQRILSRLIELKMEEAQSWSSSDWLSMIENLMDDIGRYVDRLVSQHKH